MAGPAGHIHVSEREVAHTWPDGQKDDSAWEDCTMDSGLELVRVCHSTSIPATHAETEALRAASGKGPLGGSNTDDLIRGLRVRYGWTGGTKVSGFTALWNVLQPGYAAMSQGKTGVFLYGHTLRRHLPNFTGGHAVFIARLDLSDRVWWCDPLAPKGTYQGQWVSKADLARYVNAFGGSHLVAKFAKDDTVATFAPVTSQVAALIDILPGAVLYELDGKTVIKSLTGTYKAQLSPYAAGTFRAWFATLGGVLRPVLVKGATNIKPVVDNSPFTQAQLTEAVQKAVATVSAAEKARLGEQVLTVLGLK